MRSGILVVYKKKGMTSRDVVNQVCKIFQTRKVGHMGTLDPLAEGVLVLGINDGTKVIELLTNHDKEYIAKVVMGLETDTLDMTGKVLRKEKYPLVTKETLENVVHSFVGCYSQEVPIYSAVHVQGKRLYQYAREQETVELPKRDVQIEQIQLLDTSVTETENQTFRFSVTVSKGTYIRSLIRDIGERLEIPCTMQELLRVRQGSFLLEQAKFLREISADCSLIPLEDAIPDCEKVIVSEELEFRITNGQICERLFSTHYGALLDSSRQLLAIYQVSDQDPTKMRPYKVFSRRNI